MLTDTQVVLSSEDWCKGRTLDSPQFHFWYLELSMELVILLLIRAFREINFELYCQAFSELLPYLFANNHLHYARWLTIHLQDMLNLDEKHPRLAEKFNNGKFVVDKSTTLPWSLTKLTSRPML